MPARRRWVWTTTNNIRRSCCPLLEPLSGKHRAVKYGPRCVFCSSRPATKEIGLWSSCVEESPTHTPYAFTTQRSAPAPMDNMLFATEQLFIVLSRVNCYPLSTRHLCSHERIPAVGEYPVSHYPLNTIPWSLLFRSPLPPNKIAPLLCTLPARFPSTINTETFATE